MRRMVAVLFALMLLAPSLVGAVSLNAIAKELRCPTCNTPLNVSSAPIALDMKAEIRRLIAAGATRQEILDRMVRDFGRQVLATPPKKGFDLVAWLVPPLLGGAGLVLILIVARTSRRHRPALPDGPGPSAAEAARLRRLLGERDVD